MSVQKATAHAKTSLKHAVGYGLSPAEARAQAEQFISSHQLYGAAGALLPKTGERIRDLAQQVGDGFISPEEADGFAELTAQEEFESLSPEDQAKAVDAFEQGLLNSL